MPGLVGSGTINAVPRYMVGGCGHYDRLSLSAVAPGLFSIPEIISNAARTDGGGTVQTVSPQPDPGGSAALARPSSVGRGAASGRDHPPPAFPQPTRPPEGQQPAPASALHNPNRLDGDRTLTSQTAFGASANGPLNTNTCAQTTEAVSLPSCGRTLRGGLFRPEDGTGGHPVLVAAAGMSCVKEGSPFPFARSFAAGGLDALAFDSKNFGDLRGEPRKEVEPQA